MSLNESTGAAGINDLRSALDYLKTIPGQLVSTSTPVDPFAELAPRLLSARFLSDDKVPVQVTVVLTASDRKGLLLEMIQIITEQGGNVSAAKVDVKGQLATLRFTVSMPHISDLPKMRTALSMVDAVKSARLEHQNP